MGSFKLLTIPNELQPIQVNLQRSIAETIILTPSPSYPTITRSKLAGLPYTPKNASPVLDAQGVPMLLLAQLNFAELAPLENFPNEGILQFFIAQNCYTHYTVHDSKSLFKVRYYEKLEPHFATPATNSPMDFTHFPIKQEQLLHSHTRLEPVSATDYRLSHFINPYTLAQPCAIGEPTLNDLYMKYFLSADHKIGGYPYFIYEDIRTKDSSFSKYDTLLFQLISNDAESIMWGDSGVINFFINSDKLKQRDFNDVLFYAEDY